MVLGAMLTASQNDFAWRTDYSVRDIHEKVRCRVREKMAWRVYMWIVIVLSIGIPWCTRLTRSTGAALMEIVMLS